ncbi:MULTISPECIES: hypothetical protein [Cryobacterium]|uniref:hypothetical protein n=1 Tax=Cryobacterium TaxID=69578 RepID=UPI000D4F3897|nr:MULTISPECIES: hypothetical protein [Cryobacterium]POH69190.1 hypothetical protein C3B60_03410 [Cryobacterium zongtaii]TFC41106.1 hypothetical protein E3O57_17755 [Cryobacterium sp. TMN-39-2]
MTMSTRTRLAALACAAGLTITLSACGQAPWAGLEASPSATPKTKATLTAIENDLATGSTRHQITAGDAALTVDYSSSLNMGEWTAAANKPVSLSLSATLGTDDGQDVFLSKMTVITAVTGPTGALEPPAPFVDQTTLVPGYLMKAPYSYGQTYVLSALDPTATSVTLSFTYELLIQTTPTSASFAKQTASDQITVAIVP